MTEKEFFHTRTKLTNNPDSILSQEQYYAGLLLKILEEVAQDIYIDFSLNSYKLLPFWKNYPPEQRGRQPKGDSMPLLELGEKTLSHHIIRALTNNLPDISFPGVPTGGDIRFSTKDAFVHFDIKLTGPNDNPDEIVVPPNQVSGDGRQWQNAGIVNSSWPVLYQTGRKKGTVNYHFQPKLPPFYILDENVLMCLTFFLKAIYAVKGFGIQPLSYFELACVPNGLLMFENFNYWQQNGLIIAGKDDKSKLEDSMRIRIRLEPLAEIQEWRSIKIFPINTKWQHKFRRNNSQG